MMYTMMMNDHKCVPRVTKIAPCRVVSWDAPTAGEFGSLEMREDLDKNVRE